MRILRFVITFPAALCSAATIVDARFVVFRIIDVHAVVAWLWPKLYHAR
jgi:hypothetical protein